MVDHPDTERRESTVTYHGHKITDPYQWLELYSNHVKDWVSRQNTYADGFLQDDPRDSLNPLFQELADSIEFGPIVPTDRYHFQRIRQPEQHHSVLTVREDRTDKPETILDPNQWSHDGRISMDWFLPSKKGTYVAYGMTENGKEHYDIRIIDVSTQTRIDEIRNAGRTTTERIAWTDSGLYYTGTGGVSEPGQLEIELYFHELGVPSETVICEDFDRRIYPEVVTTDTDDLIFATHFRHKRSKIYLLRDESLRPLITDIDATFQPYTHDGTLYFWTDHNAPNFQLLAADQAQWTNGTLDVSNLTTVLRGQNDRILREVSFTDGYLIAHYHTHAQSELEMYSLPQDPMTSLDAPLSDTDTDKIDTHQVSLPDFVGIEDVNGMLESPGCFFQIQSFDQPARNAIVRLDEKADHKTSSQTHTPKIVNESGPVVETDISIHQEYVQSTDGAQIPLFLVHRSDQNLEDAENIPTLMYGYGGFRRNLLPEFNPYRLPFIRQGGLFVQANLRGGIVHGEDWHTAGMRANKQQTFDDFLAVASHLIEEGYTDEEHLGIRGRSNGGLLVGASITQRPDLFEVAISDVPLQDMIRFHRFLLGERWTVEYGSPEDKDAFEYLSDYSPYHNVERQAYPATLLKTAENDTRVHPLHGRKMAARMQAKTTGDEPILLRTRTHRGHRIGRPEWMFMEEELDDWTFISQQLGIPR